MSSKNISQAVVEPEPNLGILRKENLLRFQYECVEVHNLERAMYKANSYKNVMELLVDDEIDRQTCHYSPDEARAINRIEVAAHALNRLPPLYASSQEGIGLQFERGQREYTDQITATVSQALSQIHQEPSRTSTPIPRLEEIEAARTLAEVECQSIYR